MSPDVYLRSAGNKRFPALLCLLAALAAYPYPLIAQDSESPVNSASRPSGGVTLTAGEAGAYTLIERSDWSRYDNGKYLGHVYREVRASITPEDHGGARIYRGNFMVMEETLRNMQQSARGVDAVTPVSFTVSRSGEVDIENDQGFPSLRGFPTFPAAPVKSGDKWQARGIRAVDPLNQGSTVLVPLIAEYQYQGTETYQNTEVHRISAVYASRYQGGGVRTVGAGGAPAEFTQVQGTHKVDILLRVSDGLPLLMRDNLDETFTWADGSTVRFRGFTLTFGEGTIPLNRDVVIASLGDALGRRAPARGPGTAAPVTGTAAVSAPPPRPETTAPRSRRPPRRSGAAACPGAAAPAPPRAPARRAAPGGEHRSHPGPRRRPAYHPGPALCAGFGRAAPGRAEPPGPRRRSPAHRAGPDLYGRRPHRRDRPA
jgi:hypothetical protein